MERSLERFMGVILGTMITSYYDQRFPAWLNCSMLACLFKSVADQLDSSRKVCGENMHEILDDISTEFFDQVTDLVSL